MEASERDKSADLLTKQENLRVSLNEIVMKIVSHLVYTAKVLRSLYRGKITVRHHEKDSLESIYELLIRRISIPITGFYLLYHTKY